MSKPLILAGLCLLLAACTEPDARRQPAPRDTMTVQRSIEDVLRDHRDALMNIEGVVSTGQALCDEAPCISVGVLELTDELQAAIPDSLEGYPVSIHVSGRVVPRSP